jgi:anti-sigma regulatory factor (Ser/Thr protein kinase)
MTIVPLPHTLDSSSMYGLIKNLINEYNQPIHNNVTFDFSSLVFIKPVGITILSNLIEWLYRKEVKFGFQNHTKYTHANKYLDDSLFFLQYTQVLVFPLSSIRPTTIPLQLVKHEESYSWIEHRLLPWLSRRLNMTPRSFETIKICLQELFNNINDHAQQKTGSIFVQQYPKKNIINIALSDVGVGIPYNICKKVDQANDSLAILLATTEGFTTRSTPRNAGAGLDIFLQVLARNNGNAAIYSNRGALSCITSHRS